MRALINRSPFLTASLPRQGSTPDLVLYIHTPGNDFGRLHRLIRTYPDVPIAALLLESSTELRRQCEAAGVAAVALPTDPPGDLERRCLELIEAGVSAHNHLAAMRLADAASSRLTVREQEVLELLTGGYTNRQMAGVLGVSEHTIRAHMRGIMAKMNVSNRVQAVSQALSLSTQGGVAS